MSDPPRPIAEEELHAYVDHCLDPAASRQCFATSRTIPMLPSRSQPTVSNGTPCAPLSAPSLWNPFRLASASSDSSSNACSRAGRPGAWQPPYCSHSSSAEPAAGSCMTAFTPQTGAITLLAQEAVANHVVYTADKRRPTELGAQQRDDLARWVSNRLNHQVAPPDLSADGYSYMGGRLAATPDGPAGLFMYDNGQGMRLTIFVLPLHAAAGAPIQHVDFSHVDGCAWIDNGVGYTVVGKLPPPELRRIAEQVRRQFEGAT